VVVVVVVEVDVLVDVVVVVVVVVEEGNVVVCVDRVVEDAAKVETVSVVDALAEVLNVPAVDG